MVTKTNLSDIDPDANSIQGMKEPCRYYNEKQFEDLIKCFPSDYYLLSAFHFNIRSLPKNDDHLSQFLASIIIIIIIHFIYMAPFTSPKVTLQRIKQHQEI